MSPAVATSIPQIVKDCRGAMDKALESARRELSSIRSGKASPAMLDTVRVDAYGQSMPLNQVASVAAPEPRLLIVTPWDKGLAKAIEKAIRESDLGLDPAVQGGIIRVPLPSLNEQRRKDLVKVVHKLAEEGRIAIRHAQDRVARPAQEARQGVGGRRQTRREGAPEAARRLYRQGRRRPQAQGSRYSGSVTMHEVPASADDLLARIRVQGGLPRHVAIIMDGNGRWAQERLMPRPYGHRSGMKSVREVVEGAVEAGLSVLSLFAFSQENWQRPRPEIRALMSLLEEYIAREVNELRDRGVRVRVLGELDRLTPAAASAVERVVTETEHNDRLRLNLFIPYGGRAELVRAARLLAEEVQAGTTESRPDLGGGLSGAPLYGRLPRPRSPDPHVRRAANLQFSAVADGVR